MATRKDQGTGMFVSDQVGGYFATPEDARAAEQGHGTGDAPQQSPDTLESDTGGITEQAAADPGEAANPNNPGGMSDNEMRRRALKRNQISEDTKNANAGVSPTGGAGASFYNDPALDSQDGGYWSGSKDQAGNRFWVRPDNYRGESADIDRKMGTVTDHGMVGGVQELGFEAPQSGPGGAGGGGNRETAAGNRTAGAQGTFEDENAANAKENAQAWGKAWDAIGNIKGGDYGMSDEARAFQKEGLQQQRDLLKRTLGFDPNQYATQFADQGLARSVALARSGGSAAQQQAQTFAALEGAPALYAEGARTAAGLENQRLATAETAAKAFGDLGTMTRNSDENRAEFESNLTSEIAKQTSALTQGQVTLNEDESKMFAQMWTDFAQLQSVYAGMDSDEQLAWWQKQATERGQDKQLEGILASLRQSGAISSKDLIGGLFQLGGGVIGAGGMIGAAYAGKH